MGSRSRLGAFRRPRCRPARHLVRLAIPRLRGAPGASRRHRRAAADPHRAPVRRWGGRPAGVRHHVAPAPRPGVGRRARVVAGPGGDAVGRPAHPRRARVRDPHERGDLRPGPTPPAPARGHGDAGAGRHGRPGRQSRLPPGPVDRAATLPAVQCPAHLPPRVAPGRLGRVAPSPRNDSEPYRLEGHAGDHAGAVFTIHGLDTMWTLSGAHVFPLYDAAVRQDPPMRIVDVRHEQTAVFGAEATAKLTRRPGLAVLTAGPGITNGVSGIAQAYFSGVPLLAIGGRAPQFRWGTGALQELDHPPILATITKNAVTARTTAEVAAVLDDALRAAASPHRGPVFVDVPMDELFGRADVERPTGSKGATAEPDQDDLTTVAARFAAAERPVLVLGSDVWLDRAEDAARRFAYETGVPVVANGMGRGILRPRHPLLVNRARSAAFNRADLVVAAGTPLDFRLGYGAFPGNAEVVHIADSPEQIAGHVDLAGAVAGDLTAV